VPEPSDADVVRNEGRSRYELHLDGEVQGWVDFRIEPDGAVSYTHAQVDPGLRGKGFSPVLVSRALDDARARGERVIARCAYVDEFQRGHPEYADVFATEGRS